MSDPLIKEGGQCKVMTKMEQDHTSGIRPWSCARAAFRIKTPGKGQLKARRSLQKEKRTLVEGLSRAPFVNAKIGETMGRALVDTGADWSLLNASGLTGDELAGLQECNGVGQGVSKEPIRILGEVWRDVILGNVTIPFQRFVVVQEMVTGAILGADFWVRMGEMTVNFRERKLLVQHLNLEMELFETEEEEAPLKEEERSAKIRVQLKEDVTIPPNMEKLVTAKVAGCTEGQSILVEPRMDDSSFCSVPFTVCRVSEDIVNLRIANIGSTPVTFKRKDVVATATTDVQVVSRVKSQGAACDDLLSKVKIGDNLTEKQRSELSALVMRHKGVFYEEGELPIVNVGIEHSVRLKQETGPVAFQPRRLSREAEREVREELKQLQKMGVIRPSNSPWAAPIVCARRQDGSLRLAIDYRSLNSTSLPATLHPIPRMDDLVDRLAGAKYFAVLDAKCGYHQMPLKTEEAELTAFVVPWAHYEFKDRTPFGLKGAGYSFQRFMSRILGESNFVDAICYLDDVLVWGPTWEIFMARLRRVLQKISDSGLALSAKKCAFGVEEVIYLGTVIKNGMVGIGEQRTEQLRGLPSPRSIEEVRRVLGAFAFVQKWLPGLSDVARPLYDLVGGNGRKKFAWNGTCEKAFVQLKEMVSSAVSLRIPRDDAEFTVVSDASDTGTGGMLAQKEGNILVPVAFCHHTLSPAERKYDTTEKELLAVVVACKKWRIYLDQPFDLITDHNALRWLNTLAADDVRGRRGRWVEFLQQFEIRPIHKKGRSSVMSMADYLSRVTPDGDVRIVAPLKVSEYSLPGSIQDSIEIGAIAKWQAEDPEVHSWIKAVQENEWEQIENPPKVKDRMFLDSKGILRVQFNKGRTSRKHPFGRNEISRVVVPLGRTKEACKICHDAPLAGHMGIRRSWQRARDSFWWADMKKDMEQHVKDCEGCGLNKHSTLPSQAPVQSTDIPTRVLEKLQVDFLGPFGISTVHEYRYALQIQDVLSRFVVFVPTVRNDALSAANSVFDEWVCKFSFPIKIQSDQGRHFAAEVFEKMCERGKIKHVMGSVGHAQSQGLVERQNQLLNQTKALCANDIDKWPVAIYRIQHAHNTARNETTGISPYEMMFGQAPRSMESTLLMEEEQMEKVLSKVGAVEADKEAIRVNKSAKEDLKQLLTNICRQNIMTHQKQQEESQTSRAVAYEIGDLARIKLNDVEKRRLGGKKIAPRNSEPYLVVEKWGEWTYLLVKLKDKDKRDAKKIRRHYNELVRCNISDPEIRECYWITMPQEQYSQEPVEEGCCNITEENSSPNALPELAPRRSARERRPVERLQLDWNSKRYTEKGSCDEDREVEEEESLTSEDEDVGDLNADLQ